MKKTIKYSRVGMMREIKRRGELSCREVLSRYRVFVKRLREEESLLKKKEKLEEKEKVSQS